MVHVAAPEGGASARGINRSDTQRCECAATTGGSRQHDCCSGALYVECISVDVIELQRPKQTTMNETEALTRLTEKEI